MTASGTFRGASAEALHTLTSALDQVTGDRAVVGQDLFRVAALLRGEPALRRVATDQSVAAEAKQGLLRELLVGKVGDVVVDLAGRAVSLRWTASRDLADALEHLGVLATVRSADDSADRLADELFEVGQLVADNPELRDALSDPARSTADKQALVRGILAGKALPATVTLAEQALTGSYRTVGVALHAFQQVAAAAHNQSVAEVRVAKPLSDADRQRLGDVLSRQYGRQVHVNVVVDAEVIGGIRVEIGDDVIDGTVSSRLDSARRALAV
ncbi:F0F1 ATP synthase subunit delta [Nocardioides daejeonensis]|uniref:F0F1 ATP synthase subunit delta n=1 Tax=Nocardioides daejeonensis TaxID=1046556 RepID=UPI000D75012C|nr:F0F1 ATP synthase subunit delta [Nocardioides daejeonensis]